MQAKLGLLASLVTLAGLAACHKNAVQAADTTDAAAAVASDTVAIAATAPADEDADAGATEIAPPDAVVAQDPNIPVNEAVVGTTPIPADYTASFAPPVQPVTEDEPARPEADDVWVPGYWWWSRPLNHYVWVGGAWRHPPPDRIWNPGGWSLVSGRYAWTPGYWAPRGEPRIEVELAPPPMRVEVQPPTPGVGFIWTPGSYAWRGGRYEWSAGTWVRPPREGVAWVEPRWVHSGGRYYLQPGRWDVPPERRGVVYRPVVDARPGVRLKLDPLPPAVIVSHANFVAVSSRAVARGAVRTERGGFVVPHAVVAEVVRPDERAHVIVEPRRVEVGPRVETRVDRRVEPRIEVHENVAGRPPVVEQRVNVGAPRVEERGRVEVRPQVQVAPQPQRREERREVRRR